MAKPAPFPSRSDTDSKLVAVLGPTNTGKTHLAIERLCAHSSGAIGFPLRLLAREVYDRVCAIKGAARVALITGEERIEPPGARWLLCTAEAMPLRLSRQAGSANNELKDLAFVALDEAQLCADRERGHVFTDRLLHARGREETMILGSATIEPMVRALLPRAEINSRPRFSTLSHSGARKLSRVPPRSAVVAFSAEQVYVVAELLRRFRGGAAVVMGAMSPETRNRQVALYQSGEVDYLVATDAIGMGLNLDLDHVAFAGLSKFDGQRQRRLTPSEMAQIAGRAGRHQRDGTFGTLSGSKNHDAEFTPDEVYAIEEHRFAPITRLFWRDAEPRLDSLETLIADLSAPPERPELAAAPEAIDLAVMRRLADDPDIAATVRGRSSVARFREVCMLPDFRQHGAEVHSRFIARLWEDLRRGSLATDYVAARVADLDNPAGDIDTLQGRLAAIRSWSYISQRPDWVLCREEMAALTRSVEARLSDALHARLTERFVNRRLSVLMKRSGADTAMHAVTIMGEEVLVDGESIGKLEGFRFKVDPEANHEDHKLLLAAAERHLPRLLAERATALAELMDAGTARPVLVGGAIMLGDDVLARLQAGRTTLAPQIKLEPALEAIPLAE
ncbi:MAG: helicase-related protein, partial [Novosphingobium sp.]